jgi:hypothetical protein
MKEEETELEEISASVVRYYDSLSNEEIAEDSDWAEFAVSQLAAGRGIRGGLFSPAPTYASPIVSASNLSHEPAAPALH